MNGGRERGCTRKRLAERDPRIDLGRAQPGEHGQGRGVRDARRSQAWKRQGTGFLETRSLGRVDGKFQIQIESGVSE